MQLRAVLTLIAALNFPASAADVCDPGHFQGPYGFLLYGDTRISGDSKPVTSLGRVIFDGDGSLHGYSSVMFAGLLLGNPVTGTYEVLWDCTMSWRLQDDSGAVQHFTGVVTLENQRVRFRQTEPGSGQRGTMARTSDACTTAELQKKYAFTLSGSSIPMLAGQVSSTVAARGLIEEDNSGNFKLTQDDSPVKADVTVTVESDCIVHLGFSLPGEEGETSMPMTLRGILVNDGKEILAIQTDPGSMVWARFTAR